MKQEVLDIIKYYIDSVDSFDYNNIIVEMLKEIQKIDGYINDKVVEYISKNMNLKISLIEGIIKRNKNLKDKLCKTIILCTGARCMKRGSYEMLKLIEKDYTHFKVETKNCFRDCGKGPNLSIDEKIYNGINSDNIKKILE